MATPADLVESYYPVPRGHRGRRIGRCCAKPESL